MGVQFRDFLEVHCRSFPSYVHFLGMEGNCGTSFGAVAVDWRLLDFAETFFIVKVRDLEHFAREQVRSKFGTNFPSF